jgi:hypothetical protein
MFNILLEMVESAAGEDDCGMKSERERESGVFFVKEGRQADGVQRDFTQPLHPATKPTTPVYCDQLYSFGLTDTTTLRDN